MAEIRVLGGELPRWKRSRPAKCQNQDQAQATVWPAITGPMNPSALRLQQRVGVGNRSNSCGKSGPRAHSCLVSLLYVANPPLQRTTEINQVVCLTEAAGRSSSRARTYVRARTSCALVAMLHGFRKNSGNRVRALRSEAQGRPAMRADSLPRLRVL
jgi:hypothetical protein